MNLWLFFICTFYIIMICSSLIISAHKIFSRYISSFYSIIYIQTLFKYFPFLINLIVIKFFIFQYLSFYTFYTFLIKTAPLKYQQLFLNINSDIVRLMNFEKNYFFYYFFPISAFCLIISLFLTIKTQKIKPMENNYSI